MFPCFQEQTKILGIPDYGIYSILLLTGLHIVYGVHLA